MFCPYIYQTLIRSNLKLLVSVKMTRPFCPLTSRCNYDNTGGGHLSALIGHFSIKNKRVERQSRTRLSARILTHFSEN